MRFSLAILLALLASPAAAERPNIVLILCDDLGYSDVGFNGADDIETPQLDQLARDGTIFRSAYAVHPFCGPSRMGLMTGRYPHAFGSPFNLPETGDGNQEYYNQGIDVDETLISTVLQRAGYYTGAMGKWHMGTAPQFHPNARGFDDYYGFLGGGHKYFPEQYRAAYEKQLEAGVERIWDYLTPLEHNGEEVRETEYLTDALSGEAVRFINAAAEKNTPFFLYVAYNAPHTPLEAKKEDIDRFANISDKKRRTYAGMVYAVDRGVGRIAEALRANGSLDNTLLIFLSDNGGQLNSGATNRPLKGGKGDTYEGGYRVPMFFHWPGVIPAGSQYDYPVTALDFYPTFAGLAEAEIPADKKLDGKDLWDDFLAGRSPRPGENIYAVRHRDGFSDVGVRQDQWKACRAYRQPWKLCDVDQDMGEEHDLSAEHRDRLEQMVSQAKAWSETHTAPRWFHALPARDNWIETRMPNYDDTFEMK